MKTIDPGMFVTFKQWMANYAPDRPARKKLRDLRQAQLVQKLLDSGQLVSRVPQA